MIVGQVGIGQLAVAQVTLFRPKQKFEVPIGGFEFPCRTPLSHVETQISHSNMNMRNIHLVGDNKS